MLNRIFVRESEELEYVKKKDRVKIGVVGMAQGVGASFVGISLAKELSKDKDNSVAYVEGMRTEDERAELYDSLGMDKRFLGKTYFDFFDAVDKGIVISDKINLDERINWALKIPSKLLKNKDGESVEIISSIKFISIVNNISANVVVCDLNEYAKDEDVLAEMDVVVFVIDPLPSRLICGYEKLCYMKKQSIFEKKIIYVLNKNNDGVNRGELYDFLRLKPDIVIPALPSEPIYIAEYNCKIPYMVESVNKATRDIFLNLIDIIFSNVYKSHR